MLNHYGARAKILKNRSNEMQESKNTVSINYHEVDRLELKTSAIHHNN